MEKKVLSCEFNIDTASVEVKYADGSMISINCTKVEKEVARAGMVKSVDTRDLKSLAVKSVPVRSRSPAPNQYNPNQIFPVGDGFGFIVFFSKFEDTHFRNGVMKRPESKPRGPRKKKQI